MKLKDDLVELTCRLIPQGTGRKCLFCQMSTIIEVLMMRQPFGAKGSYYSVVSFVQASREIGMTSVKLAVSFAPAAFPAGSLFAPPDYPRQSVAERKEKAQPDLNICYFLNRFARRQRSGSVNSVLQ
jgi:hypothetical protein